jgi:four helix bundle protein
MDRYEDFKAWQLTHALNALVFDMTSKPPASHDFKFRDNLRDAADSAERNFPEGFGKFAPSEFAHFLDHSRASLLETRNELLVGLERGYFTEKDTLAAASLAQRALGALSGLQRYLRSPRAKENARRARERHIRGDGKKDHTKRTLEPTKPLPTDQQTYDAPRTTVTKLPNADTGIDEPRTDEPTN